LKAARHGSTEAQKQVATLMDVQDKRISDEEKLNWLQLAAADPANEIALNQLGIFHLQTGNEALGIQVLKGAAENGNIHAMINLGWVYKNQREYDKAFKYFVDASKKGSVSAMSWVGEMLYQGQGVKPNQHLATLIMQALATKKAFWPAQVFLEHHGIHVAPSNFDVDGHFKSMQGDVMN
jgi:TPR repeat protein